MLRTYLLLLSLLLSFGVTRAQLTMTLEVPPTGILLKPQLWNAVIVNSYPETRQIYLGLSLADAATGEPVLTATTSQIAIEPGALQVQSSNLSPITYDYLSANITDLDPDGFLPAGNYTACYTLFLLEENVGTPVVEDCIPVSVEPVSPPILNTPYDQEVLQTYFPQFTWIPPTPLEIFSDLNYDMILVEVQDGQSAADAIQQNLPVYTTNVSDPYLNYPSSAATMDTGNIYAWQIIAKNNDQYAAQSEIWTFSISDNIPQLSSTVILPYTKLKRSLDASISVSEETLLAYYENDAADSLMQYSIYNIDENSENNGAMVLVKTGQLLLTPGINLLSVPLSNENAVENGKEYLFQISNSRNETWSMKFIYFRKN